MINFKNKRELTFFVLGILMFLLVLGGLFYSISFLTSTLRKGLDSGTKNYGGGAIKFDIDKAKSLTD
ncbi:MAG: hypothetical protein Athens071426_424 [Parcubacteria group bacterium Athens0714_26]|nr:MAG: hypothetical protein Athens101426_627 [Parcubacteria group bacterium Athens1014_26]TSD02663.1 MAG: hypothetical protein Athens071426_424 [Parcubacteria group bacterium Athens0714_26]